MVTIVFCGTLPVVELIDRERISFVHDKNGLKRGSEFILSRIIPQQFWPFATYQTMIRLANILPEGPLSGTGHRLDVRLSLFVSVFEYEARQNG